MSDPVLGIVVFGAGIAGRVRIRDTLHADGESRAFKLVGYVSRRQLSIEGATQLTEDEALQRPDVHAVIVCTEPAEHERVIRKALDNNKHVLVEFPVATSAAITKELFSLANAKGVVLHEENIGLLTPGFHSMKERLKQGKSPIVTGELSLSGSYNGWAEDLDKSGGPFCVNVSLIQSMYELLDNDLTVIDGSMDVTGDGFTAVANLTSPKCRAVTITVKRSKDKVKREKTMKFTLEDGTELTEIPYKPPPQTGVQQSNKPGLFMQDFLLFIDEIKGVKQYQYETNRTIKCMEIADILHHKMGLNICQD